MVYDRDAAVISCVCVLQDECEEVRRVIEGCE